MKYFHKEGYFIIGMTFAFVATINALANVMALNSALQILLLITSLVFLVLVLQFFRNPTRNIALADDSVIYSPCDGKVVVIEEAEEPEYFQGKRLQISIFMSPLNVHVNRNPIGGLVKYFKYHPGKYLVAWHPKSSTENERTTIVYDNGKAEILMRQIAGAVARRIIAYPKTGDKVVQGADMGFIRFGSRVDLFLPLNTKIDVKIDDVVKGNLSIIGMLK